jgi:hypothetical protein
MYASLKLWMAGVWLIVAGFVFYWEWSHPGLELTIWNTGISIGWVAMLLCLYNLFFWWINWSSARRRALEDNNLYRPHEPRKRTRPPQEPDPNFDFSDREASSDRPPHN